MDYKKEKHIKKKWIIFIVILLGLSILTYLGNNFIGETYLEVNSSKIPKSFEGYKIVHLSDLHNKSFGKGQKKLVEKIDEIKPDIILITGDIVDSRRYNEAPSLELVNKIHKIAPVYYVSGNHEVRSGNLETLQKKLEQNGCIVLRNENRVITKNGEEIVIAGVDDPFYPYNYAEEKDILDARIENSIKDIDKSKYKILLSHRPEKFPLYVENNIDITFSGHAHGGQVRIPIIGAIIAPNQGFFPKYSSGMYKEEESTMIVSRGLGNSIVPVRVFNRPEIVVTTLKVTK
jgi:predicted MPP superfamily phosphohydrolase